MSLGSIIEATTAHFSTEFDYRKVKAFFKSRRKFVGSGRRALDQVRIVLMLLATQIIKLIHHSFINPSQ